MLSRLNLTHSKRIDAIIMMVIILIIIILNVCSFKCVYEAYSLTEGIEEEEGTINKRSFCGPLE